jgi:hypothetical protein
MDAISPGQKAVYGDDSKNPKIQRVTIVLCKGKNENLIKKSRPLD